jgi:hypothetical protein
MEFLTDRNGPDVKLLAQIPSMGSIPIARSITYDDPIGLTRPGDLNLDTNTLVLVLRWS